MPQYLLSVYQPDGAPPPPEVLNPIMAGIAAWRDELKAAGAWVFTAGLHPADASTVVRARQGDVMVTDGPFVEGKEHLGGFTVIEAPDTAAAVEWARKFARVCPLPVEVRPIHGQVG